MASRTSITNLAVIYGLNEPAPPGYTKIEKDLNHGARGEYVYLCYSTKPSEGGPITDIYIASITTKDYGTRWRPPKGYDVIWRDLNKGARGRYIYICFTRQAGSEPINEIDVIQGGDPRKIQPQNSSWTRVEQDCSEGASGDYTFVIYKN